MENKFLVIEDGVCDALKTCVKQAALQSGAKEETTRFRIYYNGCECEECAKAGMQGLYIKGECSCCCEKTAQEGDKEIKIEGLTFVISAEVYKKTGKITISIDTDDDGKPFFKKEAEKI